jgi:hypothetical protein
VKPFLAHVRRRPWLYARLAILCATVFASAGPLDSAAPSSDAFVPLFIFACAFPLFVFFWIIIGRDDGAKYSLRELFLYAPLLPISRMTTAIWTLLGVLVLSASLSHALWTSRAMSLPLAINILFGVLLLASALCGYFVQRNRLTRRCSEPPAAARSSLR